MAQQMESPCPTSLQGAEIWPGGLLQEGGGEVVLAEVDGGAHDGVAQVRHPPAAGAWDRGDETAQVQAFHEARDLSTAPPVARGGGAEQPDAEITGATAVEEVLAAEDGGKAGEVGGRRGIDRTRRAAVVIPHRLYEALFAWIASDFGLSDTIESGLVKTPRVVIRDDGVPDAKSCTLARQGGGELGKRSGASEPVDKAASVNIREIAPLCGLSAGGERRRVGGRLGRSERHQHV
jgi:hypothetical protein